MYLARQETSTGVEYIIRHSYQKNGLYYSQDVVHLGLNPSQFISYDDELHYEIDSFVHQEITKAGLEADAYVLEDIFYPFIDAYLKVKTEPFRKRSEYRNWKPMGKQLRKDAIEHTHIFDRRRIFYLRFGFNSSDTVDRYPQLYRELLQKSRDEIEQLIKLKEAQLQPNQFREYIFFIFDLQRFFQNRLTRFMPDTFHHSEIDPLFIEEYCSLDSNTSFWAGYDKKSCYEDYYLVRYLLMYFDYSHQYTTRSGPQFNYSYQQRAASSSASSMSASKAAELFGLKLKEIKQLSKKEMTSLYRKKAHDMHPDKGGDHDQFVELTEAYNELLRFLV